MKIRCPVCETSYNLRTERLTKPVVRAACKRCGNTLVIHKHTGAVETSAPFPSPAKNPPASNIRIPASIPPSISKGVPASAARDYPALIVVVAVLTLLAVAGYYLISSLGKGLFAGPEKSVSEEVKGSDRYEVCRSFVRKDEKLLASVGDNGRFTLLNDEVMAWKDKETARMTIRVQGSKGSQRIQLLLLKEKGQWRVISASEEQTAA